jgi:predicted Zn-dependent protease
MRELYLGRFFKRMSLLVGIPMVFTACARFIPPEEPCNFVQNSQSQRVSWKESVPVQIYVHQSVPEKFHEPIKDAIKEWNHWLNREALHATFNSTGSLEPTRDGYSVIYWLNSWEPDRKTEQARTTVYWSGSQIYEADIRINNVNFKYYISSDEPDRLERVHFKSLILHELGHVLGLGHNDAQGSVMNVTLPNGKSRDQVGPVDKDSLSCEYQ